MKRPPALITFFFVFISLFAGRIFASEAPTVTLLVPGMRFNLENPGLVWGEAEEAEGKVKWSGMIGSLQASGHRFGGVIRPHGQALVLPDRLDQYGAVADPATANLFALEFSPSADVDGLAYKSLEFAACLRELQRYLRCGKIRVVAYSAGGVVARAYLQNALPTVNYQGEVDRLITIATPHMGSVTAEHWGDFLGTRATSLKPTSSTIRRLNNELSLPPEVRFASIVVRGVGVGSTGLRRKEEEIFGPYVDRAKLDRLPLDYQQGFDQVVNVWSQNLSLCRCARELETRSGSPVLYALARVDDPVPADRSYFERTAHEAAPNDKQVILLTRLFLADDAPFWTKVEGETQTAWVAWQAKQHALGLIEEAMQKRHGYSEVTSTDVDRIQLIGAEQGMWSFSFTGSSNSRWRAPPWYRSEGEFTGKIDMQVDQFGRIVSSEHWVRTK